MSGIIAPRENGKMEKKKPVVTVLTGTGHSRTVQSEAVAGAVIEPQRGLTQFRNKVSN